MIIIYHKVDAHNQDDDDDDDDGMPVSSNYINFHTIIKIIYAKHYFNTTL